ncbi:MAG: hypothetical protein ACFB2W_17195 [Leptolyngbyaceae cyanobacterium]
MAWSVMTLLVRGLLLGLVFRTLALFSKLGSAQAIQIERRSQNEDDADLEAITRPTLVIHLEHTCFFTEL